VRHRRGRTTARCRAGRGRCPAGARRARGRAAGLLHRPLDHAQDGPWRVALRRGRRELLAAADRERFALYDREGVVAEARDLAAVRPAVVERLRAELGRVYVPVED
jgi:hypothetical protein